MSKSKFILLISLCGVLSSCYNNSTFYSLFFKNANIKTVADSLNKFRPLFKKLKPMRDFAKSDTNTFIINGIVSTITEPGLISLIYDGDTLSYNLYNNVSWGQVKKGGNTYKSLPWLNNFSSDEKERLRLLLKFMVDNEINSVECCAKRNPLFSFSLRGFPFADRHDMIIVFEDEFNSLTAKDKQAYLGSQLILDKKNGLILLVQDKNRFLRYMFGSDEAVPQKWRRANDQIFNVDMAN